MKTAPLEPIPELGDLPESERTATVELLLSICHRQQEQLKLQSEQLQQFKDEIAILKGEKARPKIKPSRLSKDAKDDAASDQAKKRRRRGKPKRKKTAELKIHDEQVIEPDDIPAGSQFKGYG